MMYRVGLPGWKLLACWGMSVLVYVHLDQETGTYWADSPDLDGLTVAGNNLDELRAEVNAATWELLSLALHSDRARAQTELRIRDTTIRAV